MWFPLRAVVVVVFVVVVVDWGKFLWFHLKMSDVRVSLAREVKCARVNGIEGHRSSIDERNVFLLFILSVKTSRMNEAILEENEFKWNKMFEKKRNKKADEVNNKEMKHWAEWRLVQEWAVLRCCDVHAEWFRLQKRKNVFHSFNYLVAEIVFRMKF